MDSTPQSGPRGSLKQAMLRVIQGKSHGMGDSLARGVLWAVSGLYRPVVALRNRVYDWGMRPARETGVPVISVGNLTTGGTGKTPMVEWLAQWILARGYRPAVLCRGYGRPGRKPHRGGEAPGDMNDEGLLLRGNVPGIQVVVGTDRFMAARRALSTLDPKPDCFLLDDGFQHRRLHRDLNIVLVDSLNPFGYGYLLPRGLLREPVGSLRRADMVVLTRADQIEPSSLPALREQVRAAAGNAPILTAAHKVKAVLQCRDSSPLGNEWLGQRRVHAFCALGNPDGFRKAVEALCQAVVGFEEYPDHYWYGDPDIRRMEAEARRLGADALLTTQKDAVKLHPGMDLAIPLLCLQVGIEFLDGEAELTDLLCGLFPANRTGK